MPAPKNRDSRSADTAPAARFGTRLWAVAIGLCALATGCTAVGRDDDAAGGRSGPQPGPARDVADFSAGLRCMDDLFLGYNIRDVSILLEDLADNTKKMGTGARDMMISAVSGMTVRSRAVKLVSLGPDVGGLAAFLSSARGGGDFGVVPQYDIRGSLSQIDASAPGRLSDPAAPADARRAPSRQVDVLGLDLNVITTHDMALVPGVSSRSTLVLRAARDGAAAAATVRKLGVDFSVPLDRGDGATQGMRNMVDATGIELLGRLARLPYWRCLGVGPDNAEVRREMEDWFQSMQRAGELPGYLQEQLRNRGYYDGPTDWRTSPALEQAVAAYRAGLGLSPAGGADLAFFIDFLHKPVPPAPRQPFSDAPGGIPRLTLAPIGAAREVKQGEPINLVLASSTPAYVYCYSQASEGRIRRIFPNRFVRDPRIQADAPLNVPGRGRFTLKAAPGANRFACFGAPREIYARLPPKLRWPDFEDVGLESLEAVRKAFADSADVPVAEAAVRIDVKR